MLLKSKNKKRCDDPLLDFAAQINSGQGLEFLKLCCEIQHA